MNTVKAEETNQIISKVTSSYRPEIDGLRGIAVLVVLINHVNPGLLPSGFLGVDIFFVLSGFVVTSSFVNTAKRYSSGQDFAKSFFQKRALRLLLLYLFSSSYVISLVFFGSVSR